MKPLVLRGLAIRDLRNLRQVDLEPGPTTNLIFGDNGQGKTSLLEAIYLVATSRSFRTPRLREIVNVQAQACSIRATFEDPTGQREQLVAVSGSERRIQLDGEKPRSVATFAVRTPVVVFHPGELTLSTGPAAARRKLLDRVGLFSNPESHNRHVAYLRAMRARQKLLLTSGSQALGVEPYERLMAEHGAALTRIRRVACEEILAAATDTFGLLAPQALELRGRYACGGSEDLVEAAQRLAEDRARDARSKSARFGPHRDDIAFSLNDQSARAVASQGQHRMLTLALKMAEVTCIGQATGLRPMLLLDDVSSELDAERTAAFFSLLGSRRDQVFITTTRPDMLLVMHDGVQGMKSFEVVEGDVRVAEK